MGSLRQPARALPTAGLTALLLGAALGASACSRSALVRPDDDATSLCTNGILDPAETDLDCGGPCPACPLDSRCRLDADCRDGRCMSGRCANPGCEDGLRQPPETDVDCGGPTCPACPEGRRCGVDGDCQSGFCQVGVCRTPSCSDGVRNQDESDVDCGGSCEGCPRSARCSGDGDCLSRFCGPDGFCGVAASCADILSRNPQVPSGTYEIAPDGAARPVYCDMETDGGGWTLVGASDEPLVDAGGIYQPSLQDVEVNATAPPIWWGMRSVVTDRSDVRFACRASRTTGRFDVDLSFYDVDWYREVTSGSDADSCFNEGNGAGFEPPAPARRNNLSGERLELGAPYAAGYLEGEDDCGDTLDFTVDFEDRGMDSNEGDGTDWGQDDGSFKCATDELRSGSWLMYVREPSCGDRRRNQDETDVDCGGASCGPCAEGLGCALDRDCAAGFCSDRGLCAPETCRNGRRDGEESDVDCGGGICAPCPVGRVCRSDDDCQSGACGANGLCVAAARSCREIRQQQPRAPSGVYAIEPEGEPVQVFCDMDTDGGGWTLVASTAAIPLKDQRGDHHPGLATLSPSDEADWVWGGLRGVVGGRSDMRFACKLTPDLARFQVDLSFYAVDWYQEITTGSDAQSCFQETNGVGYDRPAPARRNNLTGAARARGDDWNSGVLEGEDNCGDQDDFTVDFDDRGMDSDEFDGTDWGADDANRKCGREQTLDGAWFIFVR